MIAMGDTWEERMAERARNRQQPAKEAEDSFSFDAIRWQAQQPWLNGWPRIGLNTVLMGTGCHCVCCGTLSGVTTVAIPEDYHPPGPEPVWPFTEADCPIHQSIGDTPTT